MAGHSGVSRCSATVGTGTVGTAIVHIDAAALRVTPSFRHLENQAILINIKLC
jgi:hypothetical protein